MKRLAVIAAFWLVSGQSQYIQNGDEYQLTREGEHVAVMDYLNHSDRLSPGGNVRLQHDGLDIIVHTRINGGAMGAERITITAPEGWTADPPYIDVLDGQGGTIVLSRIVAGLM